MKLTRATLALVLALSAPSARAQGAASPAGEPSVFDLAWSALTSPPAAEGTGDPGRKRQITPRTAPRADKPTAANRAATGGRVAASAQVVKAVPVAKATAAAALPAPGRPVALDCRRYVPTAGMTISVACAD